MWTSTKTTLPGGDRYRYRIERESVTLDYLAVVELWRDAAQFREFFTRLLREAPYDAFRFETPPVTRASARQAFEFVLLDSPWLAGAADALRQL